MSEPTPPIDRLAALLESAWRWPDPFAAPDVPARPVLEAFATGLITPGDDPDLAWQIAHSVNCRRAIECLEAAGLPAGQDLQDLAASLSPAHSPGQTEPIGNPVVGSIWGAKPTALVFNPTRRASFRWRLSSPPVALLVEGPIETGNDLLWRAVLATPLEERPDGWCREDEILMEAEDGLRWHAHLWLEFPLSQEQLGIELGRLSTPNFEKLRLARAAFAEGLPIPAAVPHGSPQDESTPASERRERRRERDQLLERAQWLAATADANRDLWETDRERDLLMGLAAVYPADRGVRLPRGRRQFHATRPPSRAIVKVLDDCLALCAKTPAAHASQAVVLYGCPEEMVQEDPPAGRAAAPPITAPIRLEPSAESASSGPAFAQWDVSNLLPEMRPPCQLIVLSPSRDAILATGYVRHDGLATAVGCDWEACRAVLDRWDEWLLLIFDPGS